MVVLGIVIVATAGAGAAGAIPGGALSEQPEAELWFPGEASPCLVA